MSFKDMPSAFLKEIRDWHNHDHGGKWSQCCWEPCRRATPKLRTDWDQQ